MSQDAPTVLRDVRPDGGGDDAAATLPEPRRAAAERELVAPGRPEFDERGDPAHASVDSAPVGVAGPAADPAPPAIAAPGAIAVEEGG